MASIDIVNPVVPEGCEAVAKLNFAIIAAIEADASSNRSASVPLPSHFQLDRTQSNLHSRYAHPDCLFMGESDLKARALVAADAPDRRIRAHALLPSMTQRYQPTG